MTYFLIGLGSNIEPDKHLALAIDALERRFSVERVSDALYTTTEGDGFTYPFKNQLAVIQTELDQQALKSALLDLEEQLGREPKTPERKHRDRPIDLDILIQADSHQQCLQQPLEEAYFRQVLDKGFLAADN